MSWRIRTAIGLISLTMAFMVWCLVQTTALSMTGFFAIGLPLYGLGVLLFVWEILLDLREHRVL